MNKPSGEPDQKDAAVLEIVYYTDPLCCWSWAFEPQWRRLRYEYGPQIRWQYCMGGLLPDWNRYNDPLNAISRPVQMGPLWFEARHISGMPVADLLWMNDPPASSYPACIAVKCAGLQSAETEEVYLRRLREAAMVHSRNVAKQEVLVETAEALGESLPHILDITQFKKDLAAGNGKEAFREDIKRTAYHKISRFPTLTFSRKGARSIMIVGYRPYHILLQAVAAIAPHMVPVKEAFSREAYLEYWHGATERELAELNETDRPLSNRQMGQGSVM